MYSLYTFWHTLVVFTLDENQEKNNEIIVFLDKPPPPPPLHPSSDF